MKLICINGGKNSKKVLLAQSLANNSDCIWIKPYCDRAESFEDTFMEDMCIPLNKKQLDDKMEREVPLVTITLNDIRFVFFENQLNADFVVLIGDDRVVTYLKNEWGGDLMTIRCHSDTEEYSERNLLEDSEFDVVFDYDNDDLDTLVYKIEDIYNYVVR